MTSTAADKLKVSDIPPTTLRLAPDLRDQLLKRATINGRSLSQECAIRLRDSLTSAATAHIAPHAVRDDGNGYTAPALSDSAQQLLTLFSALSPEKQLALLTLLRR